MRKTAIVAAILISASGAFAQPRKNACTKYDEAHLDACASGKEAVWAYDFSGPDTNGQTVQSAAFKSSGAAQSDRDAAKRLCDAVDRYWNHTSCRTTYGAPYCAACGQGASRSGSFQPEQEVTLEKAHLVLDRWRSQVASATRMMLRDNASANPLRNVGKVLRDYAGALKDASRDAVRLQRIMQSVSAGAASLTSSLQPAVNTLQNDLNTVQTAQGNYVQALQQPQQPTPPPITESEGCIEASYGAPGNWLRFLNNCGHAVNVVFVFYGPTHYQGAVDIRPGEYGGTGLSTQDVATYGGNYRLYVCPKGFVPFDERGRYVNRPDASSFTCKRQ
ncbi:MAG TPA: hypothetical protein VKR52_00430 [Terracidiphilus sp.]|nr:hypothetical protein [Terracidiphilus sp.]